MIAQPPGTVDASTCSEPGYYWWLPACASSTEEKEWSVVCHHPLNNKRLSGWFLGPLRAPVSSNLPFNPSQHDFYGITVKIGDLMAYADASERRTLARLCKRVCIDQQFFEAGAFFNSLERK